MKSFAAAQKVPDRLMYERYASMAKPVSSHAANNSPLVIEDGQMLVTAIPLMFTTISHLLTSLLLKNKESLYGIKSAG